MSEYKQPASAIGQPMENKDIRKLTLYSKDGHYDTSVEAVILTCFFHMIELNVHRVKDFKVLSEKVEASHFTINEYQCILERESTLREHATLVGGVIPILRFIYASEMVSYEWYPQNPLDRAKLDQFFDWFYMHRTQGNLIKKSDLATLEEIFIGETQPYLLGMHDMTIVDLISFFAILPAHQQFFESEEGRRLYPKITRWAERLMDNEDLMEYLQTVKLTAKTIDEAK